jgi:hypothetical protein
MPSAVDELGCGLQPTSESRLPLPDGGETASRGLQRVRLASRLLKAEVAETGYQALQWLQPRRLVVVREPIQERHEAHGRMLFEVPGYTFHSPAYPIPLAAI